MTTAPERGPTRCDMAAGGSYPKSVAPICRSMRATLLGIASMLALAAISLPSKLALALPCSPSNQIIATSVPGPINSDGGSITITGTGLVSNSSGAGVQVDCPAATIDNAGSVVSVTGVSVRDIGSVGVLSNGGTISFSVTGISNTGTISQLSNSGTIVGDSGSISGISNAGTVSELSNSGGIIGSSVGISNTGTIGQLSNSGTSSGGNLAIFSSGTGISNTGTISQLSNSGVVNGGFGISNTGISNGGTIGQLSNSGGIIGSLSGGFGNGIGISNAGTIGQLSNSGVISGGNFAIFSSGTIGPITNSGAIVGNIEIQRQNVTLVGSSGNVFAILTGGNMTITDGNLSFAGGNQQLAQNITVNAGQGTVTNAGNLLLISPQSITGNYVQGSAGSLIIGIGISAANAGRLEVLGRLDVSGTVTLLDATVVPRLFALGIVSGTIGQQFQIISAQRGVQGSLAGLIQPDNMAAGTRFDALYSPSTINLVITPSSYGNLTALGIAASAAATAVGSGLDAARPNAGVAMTPNQASIYAPLYTLTADQIAPALQQMAPVIYADTLMVNRSTFQMIATAVNHELEARRGAPPSAGSSATAGLLDTTIWLAGTGQFLNLNSAADGTPGYSGSSGGVVAGIDSSPWADVRIGAAIGFSSQTISAANEATYSGHALQVLIYGSVQHDIAFLDAQAGAVFTEGTARRTLSVYGVGANGSVNGSGGGGAVRGGVRLDVDGWNLEPSVMLSGLSLSQGAVTETGAGAVGLAVGRSNISSLQSLIGVQLDRRIPIGGDAYAVVPSLQVGWAYEMLDTSARTMASFLGAPGSSFTVSNPSIGRSAAVLGARATLETGTSFQVFARYDAAFNNRATAQFIGAGIRYTW